MDDAKLSNVGRKVVSLKQQISNKQSNQRIQKQIFDLVSESFFNGSKDPIKCSKLIINDFSSCFYIENNEREVYVKIPKQNKSKNTIISHSLEDQALAKNEYESLLFLNKNWIDGDVSFVNVLGYNNNFNSIFTEKFNGKEFWELVRNSDFKKKVGFDTKVGQVPNFLEKIGKAHNSHQNNNIEEEKLFNWDPFIQKIKKLENKLGNSLKKDISQELDKNIKLTKHIELQSFTTKTLKGFDIRNILYKNNGEIKILDPGKFKIDFRQVDIARFLVTLRIIYWGSLGFFINLVPSIDLENSFLNNYNLDSENHSALKFIIIKELLRHWVTAERVLSEKNWNIYFKIFMKNYYITPFYTAQLNRALNDFKESTFR